MTTALKEIRYRGGLLTFRVPSHWVEKYGADGGGELYDEATSATLRLNIITVQNGPSHDAETFLRRWSPNVERSANGDPMIRFTKTVEERRTRLLITSWLLVQSLAEHSRIASFTWTLPEADADEPELVACLDLVDAEIRRATFYSGPPER